MQPGMMEATAVAKARRARQTSRSARIFRRRWRSARPRRLPCAAGCWLVQPLDAAILVSLVDPRRLAFEDAATAHLAHLLEAQSAEPGEELFLGFGRHFFVRFANIPDMSILLRSTFSFASFAAAALPRSVSCSAASKASASLKLNAASALGSGLFWVPVE